MQINYKRQKGGNFGYNSFWLSVLLQVGQHPNPRFINVYIDVGDIYFMNLYNLSLKHALYHTFIRMCLPTRAYLCTYAQNGSVVNLPQ